MHVEVDVSFGLPAFPMVGLPDASVRESRDRVRSAIRNSGFEFPPHRVTVNLAPADIRKAGSSFDLPIALGILAAAGHIARRDITGILLLGELSLDGGIQPRAACCRLPRRRGGIAATRCCCPIPTAAKPPSSTGSSSIPCGRSPRRSRR